MLAPLKPALVYSLLVLGTIVFAVPFVWMALTSVKVDREMFTNTIRFIPIAPRPRARSPYVDPGHFPVPRGARSAERVSILAARVSRTGFVPPADVDAGSARAVLADGLFQKLSSLLPSAVWNGPADALADVVGRTVTRRMTEEIFARAHRRLCLGRIMVQSEDMRDWVLSPRVLPSKRLVNLTPEVAAVSDRNEDGLNCASVAYDFGKGDRIVLSGEFDLGFDAEILRRIQIYLKPDDTWHELIITVEHGGRRYVADHPLPLANFGWTMASWQAPGPDDTSTRIRTWIVFREKDSSPRYENSPRRIKLTLEIRRSSILRAWWSKLSMNYRRVLDHIPFWRYVRVSVFLVIMNVFLTVVSSSLVAYAFARLVWPGRDFCFLLMLATMMIPGQVTMIPHFLIWKNLGAYDTLSPLWLGSAFGSAFFIFLMRQTLLGIPRDLEDAARIDGCGFFRIYWHIMLPLVGPSLAAIAIFTFMGCWNDFMGPLIYLADQRLYPLAFGLYAFSVQVGSNNILTMAASLIMTVPVIIIFFFAQKYFIQGITMSGMKG
jgi:ABC-type glycerol-3-phosphate transport system permease component